MKPKYQTMKKLILLLCLFPLILDAQIMYQNVTNKNVSLGSYGRVGMDWSYENGGSIGRRLNLNNMGSIGGRLEEQDYLEIAPALHFKPLKEKDSTIINVQARFAAYSTSLALIGNSTSSSSGGLTFAMPELYAEARNIAGKPLNVWVGARLYRGADIHIADHFYFNDHSGQGFGIEYKKTRFATLMVASTDTSSTVPPYFYLNIATGTPSLELRQRAVFTLEQDFLVHPKHNLTFLAEYHRMSDAKDDSAQVIYDSLDITLNYPSDFGYVIGLRLESQLNTQLPGSYNKLAVRYGARIANGGDGGLSRTWLTYGAPNLETQKFNGAYSLSIVEEVLLNHSPKNSINAYIVYTNSKGAANSDTTANSFWGKEIYNKKQDLTIGLRNTYYFSDMIHLLGELHYSQRKDGLDDTYAMFKFSIAPTFVPTGKKDYWARPHFRFIASFSRYNQAASENLYSPFLQYVGQRKWGHYLGVKAEWWIWN